MIFQEFIDPDFCNTSPSVFLYNKHRIEKKSDAQNHPTTPPFLAHRRQEARVESSEAPWRSPAGFKGAAGAGPGSLQHPALPTP